MPIWLSALLMLFCIAAGVSFTVGAGKSGRPRRYIAAAAASAAGALLFAVCLIFTAASTDNSGAEDTSSVEPATTDSDTADSEALPSDTVNGDTDEPDPSPETALPEDYDLPVNKVPRLHPNSLGIAYLEYDELPVFDSLNEITRFVLYNLLNENYSFDFRIEREFSESDENGAMLIYSACNNVMTYYLFNGYIETDRYSLGDTYYYDRYSKLSLTFTEPERDLEARAEALEYVMRHPVPEGGFTDFESEREYARGIHDFIAKRVTYSPIGYDPAGLEGLNSYDAKQEAYNALVAEDKQALCSAYARAFALIAQYAGIDAAWVSGNNTGTESHAWNILYPCDGSEPVIVDLTWDDTLSHDVPGQTEVSYKYFYIPLSEDTEHRTDSSKKRFLDFLHDGDAKG